jgi:hypothetical protein
MYALPWANAKGERFAPRRMGVAAAATAAVSRNWRREMGSVGMNLLLNNCPMPLARRISDWRREFFSYIEFEDNPGPIGRTLTGRSKAKIKIKLSGVDLHSY